MSIVLVEDDAKTSALLKRGLTEQGFEVHVASDGPSGIAAVRDRKPELLILDVMLPGQDGWSVLAEVRANDPSCKVLMLTARDAIEDRVRGLELGAEDYLVKPFAFPELVARIRTILRRPRSPASSERMLRSGTIEMDVLERKVTREGALIDLTPREFNLLLCLVRNAGEIVTRGEIVRRVWGFSYDTGTNIVEVHIRRLRLKLEAGHPRKLIRTVRGMGYSLDA